jgi:hypothetical protein
MNRIKLSNIPLSVFRDFLAFAGCHKVEDATKGRGGHEKWIKEGLSRPITLQTHVDPVPEMVVRSNLRTLGLKRKDLEEWLLHHT